MPVKFYMAPMEGITGYVYRNAYHRYFSPMDKYITPFIVPNQTRSLKSRELNDVLPEHNQGMKIVPQILTNCAEDFLWCADKLGELGYEEINLNLGCPFGTVVSKGRGAGFLQDPDRLDDFLEHIFSKTTQEISIKTRLGMKEESEFERLMEIFNRYPLKELIIHPRVREDYYKNEARMDGFAYGQKVSQCPVCYNGNVFCREDFEKVLDRFPGTERVMLGRGLISNPELTEKLRQAEENLEDAAPGETGIQNGRERFCQFHDAVLSGYEEIMSGERNVLFKMKELWAYMDNLFEGGEKIKKKIRKSQCLGEYQMYVAMLLEETHWKGDRI